MKIDYMGHGLFLSDDDIRQMQEMVNDLMKTNEYREYALTHKTALIDQKLVVIDILLDMGVLTTGSKKVHHRGN